MAANDILKNGDELRIVETLRIKIAELRGAPARSGALRVRNVSCSVNLDNNELYRTAHSNRKDCVIFGDEFSCLISPDFRHLTFSIHGDRQPHYKPLATISIRKQQLSSLSGRDHWLKLRAPSHTQQHIKGKILVNLSYDENRISDSELEQKIDVKIEEWNDLNTNGNDLYALVTIKPSSSSEPQLTRKIRLPGIDSELEPPEQLSIELRHTFSEKSIAAIQQDYFRPILTLSVWHDILGSWSSYFHGQVSIPLDTLNAFQHKAWYCLQERESITASGNSCADMGQLRINLRYSVDHVLPHSCYEQLSELVLETSECGAAWLLSQLTCTSLDCAARPLTRIILNSEMLLPVLSALSRWEIDNAQDVHAVFRRDTLVSLCIDELMKITAVDYLRQTLKAIIDQIYLEKKSCEIDPVKLCLNENIELNQMNLVVYTEKIFFAITNSGAQCPKLLTQVFASLRQLAMQRFPNKHSVQHMVVSCFIFLRFFAPAIMSPKLFHLRKDNPEPCVARTLTLISKTIQRLTNLAVYGSLSQKEQYMSEILESFSDERHRLATRKFLDVISGANSNLQLNRKPSVVYKEGLLHKRCNGVRWWAPWEYGCAPLCCSSSSDIDVHFRPRYFCLSDHEFTYGRPGQKSKYYTKLHIQDILNVEKVPENVFHMKFVFRVALERKILTVKASSSLDETEWITLLRKLRSCNEQLNNNYTNSEENVQSVDVDFLCGSLDNDMQMEKLHLLYLQLLPVMRRIIDGDRSAVMFDLVDVDWKQLSETCSRLLPCISKLEYLHTQYLRRTFARLHYGSMDAPIGDDNYLILRARLNNALSADDSQSLNLERCASGKIEKSDDLDMIAKQSFVANGCIA